jgi:Zn-dependent membrane protease YugP
MRRVVKVTIALFIVVTIFAIISVAVSYNKVQIAKQNVNNANQVKAACLDNKNAILNAGKFQAASDPQFTQVLNYYNSKCGDLTGRLR